MRVTWEDVVALSCESATGNQTLPLDAEVAREAAKRLVGGTRDLPIKSVCSGDVQIACTSGTPTNATLHLNTLDYAVLAVDGTNRYDVQATVVMSTVQPIPVTAFGAQCSLNINAAPTFAAQMIWVNQEHPADAYNRILVQGGQLSGFTASNFSLTGGIVCAALNIPISTVMNAIVESILDQAPFCGAPGPPLLMRCNN